MTDNFEQLLQEKIAEQSYRYNPKAWKQFCKKAGWKVGLSAAQWVVVGTLSTIAVAGGGYALYHAMTPETIAPQPTVVQQDTLHATYIDTLPNDTLSVAIATPDGLIKETEVAVKPQPKPRKTVTHPTPPAVKEDSIARSEKPKTYILRPKNPRRILEINPDTIKSND